MTSTIQEKIAVLKLGSSVLPHIGAINNAIHEVYRYLREGYKVLVVISAFKDKTDELIKQTHQILDHSNNEPLHAEFAELLATGETESASLFTIGLDKAGIKAKKLSHSCLKTSGHLLDSTPIEIDTHLINHLFKKYAVLVLPGFIGSNSDSNLTLLGRGGSDYTAVFAAYHLSATKCVLYKDTHGIFDKDPNLYKNTARCYADITFEDCLKIEHPVIQHKAINFCKQHQFKFEVKAIHHIGHTQVGSNKTKLKEKSNTPKKINVILLGLGTVGLGVYKHLEENKDHFNIVGICVKNIKKYLEIGINPELLSNDIQSILLRECDVVIELIGGVTLPHEIITQSIRKNRHIITANKALIAQQGKNLFELATYYGVHIFYSAAVAGSIPILENLAQFNKNHPKITIKSVIGILNGTCNFVLEKITEGHQISEALKIAQNLGFAEKDATLDLNGDDVAQKISIISQEAFGQAPDIISVLGIQHLTEKQVNDEKNRGKIIRLIAHCHKTKKGIEVDVRPLALDLEHPLAGVRYENNAVLIHTEHDDLIRLEGKGAGRWPTAESVYADLLALQNTFPPVYLEEAS